MGWEDDMWEDAEAFEKAVYYYQAAPPPGPPDPPKPDMHVFIDDSGDPGFKFEKGASSHVLMAACIFPDPKEIEKIKAASMECAEKNRHHREFKFNKTKDRLKDCYFDCTADVRFNVRAITVDKREVYSDKLREGDAIKSYLIRMLLTRNYGNIRNARVVIDGKDTRGMGIPDEAYLLKMVNRECPGTIHSVVFRDSKKDRGLQAADMIAGAIGLSIQEKSNKTKTDKYLQRLRPRTYYPQGTIWDFTRKK